MAGPTNLECPGLSIAGGTGGTFTASNLFCPGTLQVGGKAVTYNNVSTAGGGIAAIYGSTTSTALAANFNSGGAFTVYTPASAGPVRILYWQGVTQAATVSSTAPSLTLGYTDAGGIARTVQLIATNSGNTTAGVVSSGVYYIYAQAGTAITITSAGYASSGATPMQYALAVSTEQL